MDFLHPNKKRKQKIQLYLGYALMAVALSIATLIVVFFTLGFDVDPKTGDVIRKGLVIVDSHPVSGTATIDGVVRGDTKIRIILPEGDHSVEIKREGYRPWRHDFKLEGSVIEQFAYPFIFPTDLQTSNIKSYASAPGMVSQSPDRRWLVIQKSSELGGFEVIDLNDEDNPTVSIKLPAGSLTPGNGTHKLSAVEWSTDNRHLLVKHTWKGGFEFIVLDIESTIDSFNATKLFPRINGDRVVLRDKKFDKFYFYNKKAQSLVFANGSNGTTTTLIRDVIDFKPYQEDIIVYTRLSPADKKKAEIRIWDDGKNYLLRTIPASDKYFIDVAEFDGDFYIAAGSQKEGKVYLYRNPIDTLKRSENNDPISFWVLAQEKAEYLSFSSNARIISLQSGNKFSVYDLETSRSHMYNTGIDLKESQKAAWMDGHRLSLVGKDNMHYVLDFDGENIQQLAKANANYQPMFNRDYEAIFALTAGPGKTYNLTRTELLVEP